jgi:hypothetical protein
MLTSPVSTSTTSCCPARSGSTCTTERSGIEIGNDDEDVIGNDGDGAEDEDGDDEGGGDSLFAGEVMRLWMGKTQKDVQFGYGSLIAL